MSSKRGNLDKSSISVGLQTQYQAANDIGEKITFEVFEPAVVIDVILNDDANYIQSDLADPLIPASTPKRQDGTTHPSDNESKNYSYIGRVKVRRLDTDKNEHYDLLRWAIPLFPDNFQVPLINEVVNIITFNGVVYYTSRIGVNHFINYNPDYKFELYHGDGLGYPRDPESSEDLNEYVGPRNTFAAEDNEVRTQYGVNGRYFSFNDKIRKLKRYEGDHIIESRFGQSFRFSAYDHTRENDVGDKRYNDYFQNKENPYEDGGVDVTGAGNPMWLFRNRQRPINVLPRDIYDSPVDVWDSEKNPNGVRVGFENEHFSTIHENVNWDGTSIHITSGLTLTKFNRDWHFAKRHWQDNAEEVKVFSPAGASRWTFPISDKNDRNPFWGDQSVFMSDRIVIASRNNETLHFAKKRYGIVCDQEYTVDSHEQMVFTTNEKVVFNSPHIYLGEYNQTREPAVLGQSTIDWLYALCEWLEKHQHWYHHIHPDAGGSHDGSAPTGDSKNPYTQEPVTQHVALIREMKKRLPELCSKRVFLTGGGWAPGRDGSDVKTLFNDRVGKLNNTPGGYYVSRTTQYDGKMESSTTNGGVGPDATFNGKNPNFIRHPNLMKSNH